jgi:hypothetical protein
MTSVKPPQDIVRGALFTLTFFVWVLGFPPISGAGQTGPERSRPWLRSLSASLGRGAHQGFARSDRSRRTHRVAPGEHRLSKNRSHRTIAQACEFGPAARADPLPAWTQFDCGTQPGATAADQRCHRQHQRPVSIQVEPCGSQLSDRNQPVIYPRIEP